MDWKRFRIYQRVIEDVVGDLVVEMGTARFRAAQSTSTVHGKQYSGFSERQTKAFYTFCMC